MIKRGAQMKSIVEIKGKIEQELSAKAFIKEKWLSILIEAFENEFPKMIDFQYVSDCIERDLKNNQNKTIIELNSWATGEKYQRTFGLNTAIKKYCFNHFFGLNVLQKQFRKMNIEDLMRSLGGTERMGYPKMSDCIGEVINDSPSINRLINDCKKADYKIWIQAAEHTSDIYQILIKW